MQESFIQYVYLILILLGLVLIANKLRLASPIVLVLGGLLLSFFSAFSEIVIDPELVFFIFLPPLLYEASWQISWKELWKWRRAITSFAFPIVIITSCVIAFVSVAIIPGFTLALGFLLGGIISPPDAISATTIMRQVKAPKTLVSIAEGESLLNDASSLIVFQFALAAVMTGQFHLKEAAVSFFIVVLMGIVIGLFIALLFYAVHRWLIVTPSIEIVLTLVTPYCMYYLAEHFHYSGVLAVVSGGLFLSSQRNRMLTYRSRVEGVNVWTNFVFVLNGLIFLLIGLQLPVIIQQLGYISLGKAIGYGLLISLVLILVRILTTLSASLVTRFISRFITVADPNPGWKLPLIHGWAGIRGVVSLAAALSIPIMLNSSQSFPFRNLILFITFIVILVTLVGQGLTLPWLIRILKVNNVNKPGDEYAQEIIIQKQMAVSMLKAIEEQPSENGLTNEFMKNLHSKFTLELEVLNERLKNTEKRHDDMLSSYQNNYLHLLEQQRQLLNEINRKEEFNEELIRKYQALIDIEELKIREKINHLYDN
jgi:monovalent cation/hydrogen antiporter